VNSLHAFSLQINSQLALDLLHCKRTKRKREKYWNGYTVTTVRCRGADESGGQKEHYIAYDVVKAGDGTGDGARCHDCFIDKLITGSPH